MRQITMIRLLAFISKTGTGVQNVARIMPTSRGMWEDGALLTISSVTVAETGRSKQEPSRGRDDNG